jgi:hyperosmotically inducible protein
LQSLTGMQSWDPERIHPYMNTIYTIFRARAWSVMFVWWLAVAGCALATGSGLSDGPSDGEISKEVEAKLTTDQFGGLSGILVTTDAGVVTLVGTVERAEQKARAADLTRQVKGVKRVKNDLIIQPSREREAPPQ